VRCAFSPLEEKKKTCRYGKIDQAEEEEDSSVAPMVARKSEKKKNEYFHDYGEESPPDREAKAKGNT